MNSEFHYYAVYYLCRKAEIPPPDSFIIACSSQLVDDNITPYIIETSRGDYPVQITMDYQWWGGKGDGETTIPFHFIPGEYREGAGKRNDGTGHRDLVTPGSPRAKELLIAALKTRNLYRIGIALHGYADTWAHQNFIGRSHPLNRIYPDSILPPVGHAQAREMPDQLDLIWEDPRLIPEERRVVNSDRVLKAARMIYKYLARYNHRPFTDADLVISEYADLIGYPGFPKSREERVLDLTIAQDIPEYDENLWKSGAFIRERDGSSEKLGKAYDRFLWLKDTVMNQLGAKSTAPPPVRRRRGREDFFQSDFYRWNEAAREHLGAAAAVLRDHH
jgi:hypothetical protein